MLNETHTNIYTGPRLLSLLTDVVVLTPSDEILPSAWLDGKHGVGVPESEPRSRSPGVEVPESDVIKIWKTRSHMENTESDVREKYGKHGVIWKTRSLTS